MNLKKLHLPNTISHSFVLKNLVLLLSNPLQLIYLARLFEINLDKMFPVTPCSEETDNVPEALVHLERSRSRC